MEVAGPEDDFFASGGHSLLAMKLIHDVNEACGVELTVRSLLVEPTLGALVREVEQAGAATRRPVPRTATPAPSPGSAGRDRASRRWCRSGPRASCRRSSSSRGGWAASRSCSSTRG